MINLLPPKYRQKLKEEKWFRLILILGVVFSIVFFSLSIFLIVIQISLNKESLFQESKLISFQEKSTNKDLILIDIENWNSIIGHSSTNINACPLGDSVAQVRNGKRKAEEFQAPDHESK